MPPTKTANATRRTTRMKATPDEATKLVSPQTLQGTRPSGNQSSRTGPSQPTTEDERINCMRMVNISLQNISAATQSGWKFNPMETRSARNANTNASKVDDAVRTARRALKTLREITPDDLDVERAACSITGKLITLELYEEAVQFLDAMYPRLLRIAAATGQPGGDCPSPLHLLSVPRPSSDDPTVLTLLITSATHALNAFLSLLLRPSPPFSASDLVAALQHSHSLLTWASSMKHDNIPEKTRDALLTKPYTFVNKLRIAPPSGGEMVVDPESTFHLRMYALSCLLYTTPGTVKPATFWDQVHKACLSYAQNFSLEHAEVERELGAATCVSGSLSQIVRLAQSLHGSSFSEGRSFVQMCETWMSFAKKVDIPILDHISSLMGTPCSLPPSRPNLVAGAPNSNSFALSSYSVDSLADRVSQLKLSGFTIAKEDEPKSHHSTKDDLLVACSQYCGIFVKATASLDNESSELTRHVKDATDAVARYSKLMSNLHSFVFVDPSRHSLTSHPPMTDTEVLRVHSKLERALERLRRSAVRALDTPQAQNKDSWHATTSLLEGIATALEGSLIEDGTGTRRSIDAKSVLTSLVDVFFVLARSRLDPVDVESYTPTLSYLQRAVAAVNSASARALTTKDAATFLRCVSGTLHNLGGALYTAGRLGGAVRFLCEGCTLGRRVLALYGDMGINGLEGEGESEKEGLYQLEEQLFRRYELLGVCHFKIGDRKLAYECFVESVRTFPYTHYLPDFSFADPFGPNAPLLLKQLSSIIERLTYAATCELFLPSAQISLRRLFCASACPETDYKADVSSSSSELMSTFPSDSRSEAEITGAILTYQLSMLEGIGHKDGARESMKRILDDLLSVYNDSEAPIQRARVLLMALSASWRDGDSDGADISTQPNVDDMGREALDLLARVTPEPVSLSNHVPQLKLNAHMWLALHAYRRSPVGAEMMNTVVMHVEAAYNILGGMFPVKTKTEASPKGKTACTGSGAKTTRSASGVSKKGRSAGGVVAKGSKKVTVNAAKSRHVLRAVSLNTGEPAPCSPPATKKAATAFDLQPVLGLIQMNVHMLGLLGLIVLKVKLLEILKRVCEHQVPIPTEVYSVICVNLAHEYIKLGKSKRASALFNKCTNVFESYEVPVEVRLQYLLGQAEVLALANNVLASASVYRDAQSLEAAVATEEKTMPTAKRIRMRVERLERTALACRVFAAVQHSKDNVVAALCSMLQSLRLWNRAIDALSRLLPPTATQKSSAENSNPFEVSDSANQDQSPLATATRSRPTPTDALSWRLLSHLVSTLFLLAHAYHARGSPREALYFIQQVLDLAESTRAPAVAARACVLRGEVLLGQGVLKEGWEALERAADLLEGVMGIDAADVQRLKGDYGMLCEEQMGVGEGEQGNPREHYERAWKMLDELEQMITSFDGGRRKSSLDPSPIGAVAHGGQGMVVPRLLSAILCRHIWLLRDDGGDILKALVERLMALPSSAEIKGEEHSIMGRLTLHSVYEQFRSDMFLSSLTESAIALPMGMSGNKDPSLVPVTHDILGALNDAEKLFWADLALTSRRGTVPHVREASVSLAMIRALQSSLGKVSADSPLLAVRLLDASSAITLHREMLEAIPHKLADVHADDLQWPLMATNDSPLATDSRRCNSSGASTTSSDGCDIDVQRSYWFALEKKYTSLVLSPSSLLQTTPKLPHNWVVIHVTLTSDKSSMFISRLHSRSSQPLLFCVPLRGRRDTEDDDESRLMLEDALQELRGIVRLSDEGTRRAAHVRSDDLHARAGWWAERAALDKRLQALLENIEFCWLGAFKTILSPPTTLADELIGDLRMRLEKLFKRSLPPQHRKKTKLRLDDALLACFSSLSPKCRDEELEDLVYFILDLYQFHGVPIAISEVDMDQATMDLRTALEEHAAVRKKAKVMPIEDGHTFLVLDRSLQSIPWESLPVLRGQSVSRIPSLEFLLDRMHLAEMQGTGSVEDGDAPIDRIDVDARKTYYVLNPSGDLKGTEGRFSSWLKEMHRVGWDGIIGRAPSEQELLNALSRKDLVIYFGHGGGEQYARSHKIRHLPRCAATMLWGCSSGALKEMGEFDRVGTPHNYMVAGCPTLVANLWDVTDRDIDKFTQGVFDRLHLCADAMRGQRREGTSVVTAVARSRELCKLKYLTGAAPVVYGIPFYL